MTFICFASSPLHLICKKELAFLNKKHYFVIYCFVKNCLDAEYRQIRHTILLTFWISFNVNTGQICGEHGF